MSKGKTNGLVIVEKERGNVPGRLNGARDVVYGSYLNKLDPRNNHDVQIALGASSDPRYITFFERVMNPKYKKVSLQSIAKACNITLAEFNKWWGTQSTQIAIAEAQTNSVMITRDMVQDARSQEHVCSRCDGLGFIAAPSGLPDDTPGYKMIEEPTKDSMAKYIRDCPNCGAKKVIRKPGDTHARDVIMEMSGHLKKGPQIQINQNFGGASHASAVDSLSVMDDIMDLGKENYSVEED